MDENKHFRCSFCGKTEQEVDKLLSGPGVYICNRMYRYVQQYT